MKKVTLLLLIALLTSNHTKAACTVDTIHTYAFAPNSTVKILTARTIYKFDANNNTTEDLRQSWDATNAVWTNTVFYVYTFNAASLQTSYLFQNWVSGVWQGYLRGTNTYDVNNNLIKKIQEERNATTGLWLNQSIDEYSYNSSGQEVESVFGIWNTATSSWDYTDNKITSYTATNQPLEITNLYINGGGWENGTRSLCTYDANDNLLSLTYQTWNAGTGIWVGVYQFSHSYNASNLRTQTIYKQWDTPSASWVNRNKTDWAYLPSSKLSSETTYLWSTTGSVWVFNGRTLYTYTSTGVKDTETRQAYNSTSLAWVNSTLKDYNYDVNDSVIETLESFWNTTTSAWRFSNRKTYEYVSGTLVAQDQYSSWNEALGYYNDHLRLEYHCRGTNVGINDFLEENKFSLYPNPLSAQNLTINSLDDASFLIADIAGKTLLLGELKSGENNIQLQDLSAGVYFVKVGNSSKRFIKN